MIHIHGTLTRYFGTVIRPTGGRRALSRLPRSRERGHSCLGFLAKIDGNTRGRRRVRGPAKSKPRGATGRTAAIPVPERAASKAQCSLARAVAPFWASRAVLTTRANSCVEPLPQK